MIKLTKTLFAGTILSAMSVGSAYAEVDGGFDFDSQRGEVQTVNPVPGAKLDHHGLVINPVPQSIERPYTGELNISGGFRIKDKKKAFANDVDFLRQEQIGRAHV